MIVLAKPQKLLLFSTNVYLKDRRGRAYAAPVCNEDYTCEICRKVWDKSKRKYYMDTPDGWIESGHFWCDDCVEIVSLRWDRIMELYDLAETLK